MSLDTKLFYFFNDFAGRHRILDALAVFFAEYLQYLAVAAFLLLLCFSVYSWRKKIRVFLVASVSAAVARLGITEIIRFFYQRPRPFVTLQVHKLLSNGWFYNDKEWSFPSGHSAFFFAMATVIYLYNKKWGVWFFVAAILINISRVVVGVHYPSDIFGGAIVGLLSGFAIFFIAEKSKTK